MKNTLINLRHFLVLALGSVATSALAGIHTNAPPPWQRPSDDGQANSTLTTYQEWDAILAGTNSTPAGPNAPTTTVNPNSTGALTDNVWDTSFPGDGAFAVGTDIYSFSGVITPEIDVAGYGIAGNLLNVQVEIQSYGSAIDPSQLTVNGVLASTLSNYSQWVAYNDGGSNNGFGEAYVIDNVWDFTTADTSALKLNFGWGEVSSALEGVVVDTQSVTPAPEPASLAVLGLGALAVIRRRRHRSN